MAAAAHERAESFGAAADSVRAARAFMRRSLESLDIPEPPLENALLLGTELVTNAVQHARTRFEVRVSADGTHVRVEVRDTNPSSAKPRTASAHDTNGRGLTIVDAIAERWGVDDHGTGKAVWAELRL